MTESIAQTYEVAFGTQAFLILCQLFDGCYDELGKREELQEITESAAAELLKGVSFLQEQKKPPTQVIVTLSLAQAYFLRRLISELLGSLSDEQTQGKTRQWLEECLQTLEQSVLH